jgi:hypothetical protein
MTHVSKRSIGITLLTISAALSVIDISCYILRIGLVYEINNVRYWFSPFLSGLVESIFLFAGFILFRNEFNEIVCVPKGLPSSKAMLLLIIGAAFDLVLNIFNLITPFIFLDFNDFLSFIRGIYVTWGFVSLIHVAGLVTFRSEFKRLVSYATKSVSLLIFGGILSFAAIICGILLEFWIVVITLTLTASIISLIGYALLSKEFMDQVLHVKKWPISQITMSYKAQTSSQTSIPSPTQHCARCGSSVTSDAIYCPTCGQKLENATQTYEIQKYNSFLERLEEKYRAGEVSEEVYIKLKNEYLEKLRKIEGK